MTGVFIKVKPELDNLVESRRQSNVSSNEPLSGSMIPAQRQISASCMVNKLNKSFPPSHVYEVKCHIIDHSGISRHVMCCSELSDV